MVDIEYSGKKVLHIINGEFYAGAERVQDLLALRLRDFGYEVGFACIKPGIFEAKRQATKAMVENFRVKSLRDLNEIRKLANFAKNDNYEIIHTHTGRGALVGQAVSAVTGIPMVHHLHSPTDQDTEIGWRNLRNSFAEKLSLVRVKKIIPVSKSLEFYLTKRGYPPKKINVVWNGVPKKEKQRREYIEGEHMVIGTVALFRPRKGIEKLLHTVSILINRGCNIELHAVGPFISREYEAEIKGQAIALGIENNIVWTGFTDDVSSEFRNMHVFVLPSLYGEGLPMVVLEAMATGLPVISTSVEGIPEVIRNERDGLIVAPGKEDQLADALQSLYTSEIDGNKLGDSGWERQRSVFSDVAMAGNVASIYEEVLAH